MAKYVDSSVFLAAAAVEFDFLLGEGFVAGASEGYRRLYVSAAFSVEVMYDDRDGRVITIVDAHVGQRNPRAGLTCLFVEAGHGPAQRIREIARSPKQISPVLLSQATALRDLLPELTGPPAPALLLKCHGV